MRGGHVSDSLDDNAEGRPRRGAGRQVMTIVLAVAGGAILLRALVYLRFEQLAFDSDQAVVGLMAKHLIEGRAFPLFFYGQTYMLGVEAWSAAPVFLVAGPTVAALRTSLLIWNVAFAWLLIATLHRQNRLPPWEALVPALFFVLAPPAVALQLMNAQGGIVEPFVYVAALWLLRRRPIWFGALLGIGFRNREFVAYSVPAMLAVELLSGELDRGRIREWLAAAVSFVAVWQTVEALKPFADLMGPGTRGTLLGGFAGSQLTNLTDRFDFTPAALPDRASRLLPQIVAWFSGARQLNAVLPVPDRPWIAAVAAAYVVLVAGRLVVLILRPARSGESWPQQIAERVKCANFPLYLATVGAIAVAIFVASRPAFPPYARYAMLGLVFPIGVVAAVMVLEPAPLMRRAVAGSAIAWALLTAAAHASLTASYARHPDMNVHRIVAERLVAEGVPVATAGYWHAYVITFMAQERLRVTSRDFVRITGYQDEFLQKPGQAVAIFDHPCPGGRQVGLLWVCRL